MPERTRGIAFPANDTVLPEANDDCWIVSWFVGSAIALTTIPPWHY
ncbi:MAG: hypothetical protein JKY88_04410 [Pseudomonadales bacterium]|nr:hypothetical protein [Pseudomonadales bacterium]